MAVHLAVAGDGFDGVLFCAVLFPRDFLDEILGLNLVSSIQVFSFKKDT